jgi:hypothetical protein
MKIVREDPTMLQENGWSFLGEGSESEDDVYAGNWSLGIACGYPPPLTHSGSSSDYDPEQEDVEEEYGSNSSEAPFLYNLELIIATGRNSEEVEANSEILSPTNLLLSINSLQHTSSLMIILQEAFCLF